MFSKVVLIYTFLLRILPIERKDVYEYLGRHYGVTTSRLFGAMVKTRIQIDTLKSAIAFINTCKREGLAPTFVRFRIANPHLANSRTVRKCQETILQGELKFKRRSLKQTTRHFKRLKDELRESVPHIIYVRLFSISEEIVNKKMNKIKVTHESKLNKLRADKLSRIKKKENLDPVTNLSNYNLTDIEHAALINGLNHVYPPQKFDQPEFVCNIEYFYSRLLNLKTKYRHYESKPCTEIVHHELTSEQLSSASELREVANSFRKAAQSELKRIGSNHHQTFRVLRSLAKNKSIVITRPDKGRGVVIMDRSDYVQKMNTILDDPSTFRPINYDPTLENENRLIKILLDLKKERFITEQEYNLARPTGSRPARIYGLPKLHKKEENYPLRPVMSATKTVSYGLGKMLTYRLNHLRASPYTVKDTFDFVQKIKSSENVNKTMVSFDVRSLFTKVPLTYTIELILDNMYPTCLSICQSKQGSRLCESCKKRRNFETLLRAATSETHFIFDNKMYVQHNGVAMGAPLAPVIADIFMSHLEQTLMDRLVEIGVREWYRYVDDTFVLLEPTTKVEDVLNILNNFHPSITFTRQLEKAGSLSFLDVRVIRSTQNNKFETTIYRKETFTGLLLKWDSFVPIEYKKSTIVSMVQRALAVCSTYTLLATEFNEIRKIARKNGYPLSFIDKRIGIGLSNFLKKSTNPDTSVIGCEKKRMYVEIPYVGDPTYSLKKKLSRISSKIRPELDVRFFPRPPRSVQTFFNTKDPIPKYLQSDIVYSIGCNDCDQIYVGKTERQGIRRLREHGAPSSLFQNDNFTSLTHAATTRNEMDHSSDNNPVDVQNHEINVTKRIKCRIKSMPYPNTKVLRSSARLQEKQKTSISTTEHTTEKNTKPENGRPIVPPALSAPFRHEKENNHHMNWKDFQIVWKENNPYKLLLKESLVMKAYQTPLNRTTHSVPLVIFPEGLPATMIPNPNIKKPATEANP